MTDERMATVAMSHYCGIWMKISEANVFDCNDPDQTYQECKVKMYKIRATKCRCMGWKGADC